MRKDRKDRNKREESLWGKMGRTGTTKEGDSKTRRERTEVEEETSKG